MLGCIAGTIQMQAQEKTVESEIRTLEQLEVKAIMDRDSVTLLKLWDKDYVVNAPDNKINFAGRNTLDRPVLRRSRVSFTREVEEVIVRGDVVFAMGNETVVPAEKDTGVQQLVKRRYTNIWMRRDNNWKLVARHANIICPQK